MNARASLHELNMRKNVAAASPPVWEPQVKRRGSHILRNPSSEEDAMNLLLQRGCDFPPRHYTPDHCCPIPHHRLRALREIYRWRRFRPLVAAMAYALPEELVVIILGYVALSDQPRLYLLFEVDLEDAARSLLGNSSAPAALIPMAERALLENSTLAFDVEFHKSGSRKVASLPPLVANLGAPVRRFELELSFEIPNARQQYPAKLYSATSGMKSLLSHMPSLLSLNLVLCADIASNPRDFNRGFPPPLDITCRKGFSAETTFREAIQDLVDAATAESSSLQVTLELRYTFHDEWRKWKPLPCTMAVKANGRSSSEVVATADAKWH